MLPVSARPEVGDDLARLTPALLRALRRIVAKLRADPMRHSQPLDYDRRIGNLGDCRKVYFDEDETIRPAAIGSSFACFPTSSRLSESRSSASARVRISTSTARQPSVSSVVDRPREVAVK
jgi:hypothetical protein